MLDRVSGRRQAPERELCGRPRRAADCCRGLVVPDDRIESRMTRSENSVPAPLERDRQLRACRRLRPRSRFVMRLRNGSSQLLPSTPRVLLGQEQGQPDPRRNSPRTGGRPGARDRLSRQCCLGLGAATRSASIVALAGRPCNGRRSRSYRVLRGAAGWCCLLMWCIRLVGEAAGCAAFQTDESGPEPPARLAVSDAFGGTCAARVALACAVSRLSSRPRGSACQWPDRNGCRYLSRRPGRARCADR